MKSFQGFITERKAKNYSAKGGQGGTRSTSSTPFQRREDRAKIQDPSYTRGKKTKIFSTRPGITYATNSPSETVLGGKTPEQADQEVTRKQKQRGTQPSSAKTQRDIKNIKTTSDVRQKVRDTVAKNPTASPELQRAQSPSAPEKLIGKGVESKEAEKFRRKFETRLKNADKSATKPKPPTRRSSLSRKADEVIKSIRRGTDTSARMSAAYDKRIDKILKTPDVKSSVKIPTVSTSSAPKQPTAPKPKFTTTAPTPKAAPKPEFKTTAPAAKTAPKPKVTSNYTTQTWQGPTKSPEKIKTPTTTTTQSTLSAVKKAARQERSAIRRSVGKNLSRGVRTLGVVGAGLEAKGEYDRRKELGQSDTKALAGTAARSTSGWAGAKLGAAGGAKLGSVLGPKGAAAGGLVGGIAGYMGGADLGTAAFDAASKFSFKKFKKKIDQFRKLDHKKYSTF